MAKITVQITFDSDEIGGQEAAHAAVDALYGSVLRRPRRRPELAEPDQDDVQGILESLAVPLNDGEHAMLRGIAERAPEPLPFGENTRLLGTGARFGNVSSALTRRFASRGFKVPYKTVPVGYAMPEEIAQVVLGTLTNG